MSIRRLHSKIVSIQRELKDKIHTLNYGGCIHFAYYLSDALNTIGIPHKVYFCDYYTENLGNSFKTFDSCYHVVVYVKGIGFIDGHFTKRKSPYPYNRVYKFDLDRARKIYSWNRTYSKSNGNLIIKNTLKKYLSDY